MLAGFVVLMVQSKVRFLHMYTSSTELHPVVFNVYFHVNPAVDILICINGFTSCYPDFNIVVFKDL